MTESLNALQNLLSDDNDSNAEEEAEVMPTIDSDVYEDPSEEGARSHSVATHRKKRVCVRVFEVFFVHVCM